MTQQGRTGVTKGFLLTKNNWNTSFTFDVMYWQLCKFRKSFILFELIRHTQVLRALQKAKVCKYFMPQYGWKKYYQWQRTSYLAHFKKVIFSNRDCNLSGAYFDFNTFLTFQGGWYFVARICLIRVKQLSSLWLLTSNLNESWRRTCPLLRLTDDWMTSPWQYKRKTNMF